MVSSLNQGVYNHVSLVIPFHLHAPDQLYEKKKMDRENLGGFTRADSDDAACACVLYGMDSSSLSTRD